jgi:hypothetical protein
VKTRREHLQKGSASVVDLLGYRIDVSSWDGEEVVEGTVAVAAHQLRTATHVFLSSQALVACPAKYVGVYHDPGSGFESQHRVLEGSDHLVPEDKRIVYRNLAAEDAKVSAADPCGPDAYYNIFSTGRRFATLLNPQAFRSFEDYRAHVEPLSSR